MIHPLSTPTEIEFYLKESKSIWAVTLDAFYKNFAPVLDKTRVTIVLLAKIGKFLSPVKRAVFYLASGRKIKKPQAGDKRILWWDELFGQTARIAGQGKSVQRRLRGDPLQRRHHGAAQGIKLSSRNFNCLGLQIAGAGTPDLRRHHPIDPPHVSWIRPGRVHTRLSDRGGKCVLVPRFTPETVARLIKKSGRNTWRACPRSTRRSCESDDEAHQPCLFENRLCRRGQAPPKHQGAVRRACRGARRRGAAFGRLRPDRVGYSLRRLAEKPLSPRKLGRSHSGHARQDCAGGDGAGSCAGNGRRAVRGRADGHARVFKRSPRPRRRL